MDAILGYGIIGIFIFLPIFLIALDFLFAITKKKVLIFEILAFGCGYAYMAFCWILWTPLPYDKPINLMGLERSHEPINPEYLMTLAVIAGCGYLFYFILKFGRKHLAPLAKVFCIAGVYGGVLLHLVFLFQLLCGTYPEGYDFISAWCNNGLYIIVLCIVPTLFLLHVGKLFWDMVKEQATLQSEITYDNAFLASCNHFLCTGKNMYWVALILMLPLYGIVIAILCLFGQKPDSVIEAFTKTSDWVLSKEIAPPPVEYDAHYLCTVSLQGHKELVKPIRYGIRRGERIVVNRQLCVANAFEQLLEEKTPNFHRAVRNFYDKHGYPISKWITNPWSADVVYILMKPLEWIFVAVLYLFDEKPENRICSQYLPM